MEYATGKHNTNYVFAVPADVTEKDIRNEMGKYVFLNQLQENEYSIHMMDTVIVEIGVVSDNLYFHKGIEDAMFAFMREMAEDNTYIGAFYADSDMEFRSELVIWN